MAAFVQTASHLVEEEAALLRLAPDQQEPCSLPLDLLEAAEDQLAAAAVEDRSSPVAAAASFQPEAEVSDCLPRCY